MNKRHGSFFKKNINMHFRPLFLCILFPAQTPIAKSLCIVINSQISDITLWWKWIFLRMLTPTSCGSFLNQCYRTRLLTFDVLFMSVLTFKDLFESWSIFKGFDRWHLFSMVMSLHGEDNKAHCFSCLCR